MADPKVKVVTEVDDTQAVQRLETMLRNLQKAAEAVGRAMSSAAAGSAKYDAATARAALANERLATAATKTALGQQRVATEAERAAAAQARAEAATTRAAAASQRLTNEQNKQGQSTRTLRDNVDVLTTTLRNVTFVAGVLGTTFTKAFEFAEQGARIDQTTQSFQHFTNEIAGMPDLLDKLTAASNGTISQFELMRSTLTLVTGTTQEVGAGLARNAPQLLEIARAAQILNPALGDVDYFFQSLATGLKRLEPRWIDNLGLIVKARDAYSTYARELGISTTALTAEQKSQAFLNEVLRVGNLLIEQNAGAVSSAVDPYSQFRVEIEETGNALKVFMSQGLLPYIQLLNGDFATSSQEVKELNQGAQLSIEELSEAYEKAKNRLQSAGVFGSLFVDIPQTLSDINELKTEIALASDSFEEFAATILRMPEDSIAAVLRVDPEAYADLQQFYEFAQRLPGLIQSDQGRTEAMEQYAAALAGAADATADLTDEELEEIQAATVLADRREKLLRLNQAGIISNAVYRQAITGVAEGTDRAAIAQQRYNNLLNSTNFGPLLRGLLSVTRGMRQVETVSTGAASAFINALDGMSESMTGGGGWYIGYGASRPSPTRVELGFCSIVHATARCRGAD